MTACYEGDFVRCVPLSLFGQETNALADARLPTVRKAPRSEYESLSALRLGRGKIDGFRAGHIVRRRASAVHSFDSPGLTHVTPHSLPDSSRLDFHVD
jgi:hypothetical protein